MTQVRECTEFSIPYLILVVSAQSSELKRSRMGKNSRQGEFSDSDVAFLDKDADFASFLWFQKLMVGSSYCE